MTISGIFPHVVKNMLKSCCPKSKIQFGQDFDGIESIDNSAQNGGDIDIYFPLYGNCLFMDNFFWGPFSASRGKFWRPHPI